MTPATPTDADSVIAAAIRLREQGRWDEAVGLLNQALGKAPRNARLWQTLGTVHRAAEDSPAAIAAFEQAARLSPHDLRPAHGVAQSHLEAGRPAEALFDAARRLAPGDGAILLGRAAAQLAVGRGAAAVADLDAAVAANPLWLEGQATLARLRWMMGDAEGFSTGYARALTADPRQPLLWAAMIDALLQAERHDLAATMVEKARAALRTPEAFLLQAAICASELGDVDAADSLFARLPSDRDVAAAEHAVRHLLRRGRADQAARLAELWTERPDGARLWPYAALAWRLTGDPRAAWLEGDEALVRVIDLDMDDAIPALAERLRALHVALRDPLGQSVRGGTQTDGPLFAHEAPEIRALRSRIAEAVERHVAALGPRETAHPTRRHIGARWRFAGSWSVRLTAAGRHAPHVHPLGWLSSAFYVAVPSAEQMGGGHAGWLQLGQPPDSLQLPLSPLRMVEPKPGRLVLFPSTLWHGTLPIAEGERLTVAFDVAAIG